MQILGFPNPVIRLRPDQTALRTKSNVKKAIEFAFRRFEDIWIIIRWRLAKKAISRPVFIGNANVSTDGDVSVPPRDDDGKSRKSWDNGSGVRPNRRSDWTDYPTLMPY